MPTYGYQCTRCGHTFDVFQSMKDAPVAVCPECSGAVKRLFYPVGIVFKGSGWYVTDSRKPEKSEAGGAAEKPAAETPKETKEAKPAPAAADAK